MLFNVIDAFIGKYASMSHLSYCLYGISLSYAKRTFHHLCIWENPLHDIVLKFFK